MGFGPGRQWERRTGAWVLSAGAADRDTEPQQPRRGCFQKRRRFPVLRPSPRALRRRDAPAGGSAAAAVIGSSFRIVRCSRILT